MDLLGEILSQANAFVGAWGGRLYFVYLPAWARYANPASVNKYSDHVLYLASLRTRDRVLAFVRGLGLPIIDIHDVFQAHSDPLALFPFHQRLHYNEEGNHLIAEEVLRAIFLADLKPTYKGL